MSETSDALKPRVVSAILSAWRDLRQALSQFPTHEIETPGVCGEWSAKDVLGHITSWDTKAVSALLTGTGDNLGDIEAFEAKEAARKTGMTLRELVADAESTHRALRSALSDAPEHLFKSGSLFRESLDSMTYFHYIEHTAQIRAWTAAHRHDLPGTSAPAS